MNINGVIGVFERQQSMSQTKKQKPERSRLNGPQSHRQQSNLCRSPTPPSSAPILATGVDRLALAPPEIVSSSSFPTTPTSSCEPPTNSFTEVSKSTAPTAATSGSVLLEEPLSFEEQQLQYPAYYDVLGAQQRPGKSNLPTGVVSVSAPLPVTDNIGDENVNDNINTTVAQRKGMVRREFGRRILRLKRKKFNSSNGKNNNGKNATSSNKEKNESENSKGNATTTRKNKLFSFTSNPRAAPTISGIEQKEKNYGSSIVV